MPRIIWNSGVYCFLNLVNQKRYVGSAKRLMSRTSNHLNDLRRNKHPNTHFQHAWNKYGESNFVILFLKRCHVDDCVDWEQHYMDLYQVANRAFGYNQNPTAGSPLGSKQSEETCRKRSEAMKGREVSEEHRRKLSIALTGKTHSEETRKKIGEAGRGRVPSAETLRKRSEGIRKSWLTRTRTISDELRQKLSDAHKGIKLSKAHRRKISNALKGVPKTEEHKRNSGAAQIGKRLSPEHRRKLRLAWVRRRLRCL